MSYQLKEQYNTERQRYMNHEITHDEFYLWLSDTTGISEALIPFPDNRLLTSIDEHMNDLPLKVWDRQNYLVRRIGEPKIGSWSLCETVCCLKALARRKLARIRQLGNS